MNEQPIAGGQQPLLQRAGFEPWRGTPASAAALDRYFSFWVMRRTLRGLFAWGMWLSALLPPLIAVAWIVGRTVAPGLVQIQELGIAPGSEQDFALDLVGYVFKATVWWAVLFNAFFVSPQLGADMRAGAWLLYFSRPIAVKTYLFARVLGPFALTTIGFVAASAILFVGLGANLGWVVPAPFPAAEGVTLTGALVWPVGFAAFATAGAVTAVFVVALAHGCSVVVRADGQAALAFLALIAGSVALSAAAELTFGETSYARTLDLFHGLEATIHLGMRVLDPVASPRNANIDAVLGLLSWTAIGMASMWIVRKRLMQPPGSGERP